MTPDGMGFRDAIEAQPARLEAARSALCAALSEPLPALAPSRHVALVGIGASLHAARGAAAGWRAAGLRASALSAAELMSGGVDCADVYLAISESGRSVETVAAMTALSHRAWIALTEHADAPLSQAASRMLPLGCGEDSRVYTVGYTATLQALGMVGERWSGRTSDWERLPSLAAGVLAGAAAPAARAADAMSGVAVVDVVAGSGSVATAGEGALLLREAVRMSAAGTETHDFLHGPMEPLDSRTGCVIVGDGREVRLAGDTAALGCPTLLVTARKDVPAAAGLTVVRIPAAPSPIARLVLEILPVQLLGWELAQRAGLAVDGFRHSQDDTKLT